MTIGLLVILALVVNQLKLFDADVHLGKFDSDQSINIGNAFKFVGNAYWQLFILYRSKLAILFFPTYSSTDEGYVALRLIYANLLRYH